MPDTKTHSLTLTTPSDREVVITRVFDAPCDLVFKAWTEPASLVRWWGQAGSTLAVCEVDLRPGGGWRYVEHAADGNDYPFKGIFHEVEPPQRLVSTFVFDVEPFADREALVSVTFEDHDGKTLMTNRTLFRSVEDRDAMLQSGMERGAGESFERLDQHLTEVRRIT